MACLFAARLARAGLAPQILGAWPEGIAALQRDGVHFIDENGVEQRCAVQATTNPADCAGALAALVLVKAWQTERAARQLATCLAADGVALTLQNGMGNYETLCAILGSERAAVGINTLGAHLLQAGRVRTAGEGTLTLGVQPRLEALVALLQAAGFQVEQSPAIPSLLWGKLVINAAINPLSALLRVPNGELVQRPSARLLLAETVYETAAVAEAMQIDLPYSNPIATVEAVARRTGENRSSMLQDVLRGAPTEIEAINGAVVRAGQQTRTPTPLNHVLCKLIKGLTTDENRYLSK